MPDTRTEPTVTTAALDGDHALITDHAFLPVAGHPDDDECTHRADGTDATYCGEPRSAHLGGDHA